MGNSLVFPIPPSEVTLREFGNTKDETLRKRLTELIKAFKILKSDKKIRDLAKAHIERGIFQERYLDDALHVAIPFLMR